MKIKIISGEKKGHWLHIFPKNLPIRPMTQRVKKSVFDTLYPYIQNPDLIVLDLFSGCGNLSFEALSRGISLSHAVEKNKECVAVINKNTRKLGWMDKIVVYQQDVFQYLQKYNKSKSYGLIFIDPPFNQFLSKSLINSLKTSKACDNETLIVLEISSKEEFLKDKEILLQSVKNYGDKKVYFFHILKNNL